jgi:hypothetical protein
MTTDPNANFDGWEETSHIEVDLFCEACGYNLRSQPVKREPRTELLLARCPECSRYHSARDGSTVTRLWLQRLGTFALALWVVLVLGLTVAMSIASGGIMVAFLDEMTTWFRSGDTGRSMRRIIVHKDYKEIMTASSLGCAALGFASSLLFTIACHHWRRYRYLLISALISVLTCSLVWFAWQMSWPYLSEWGAEIVIHFGMMYCCGGALAAFAGRPLIRWGLWIILPPRLLALFSFLWSADGLGPPAIEDRRAERR